MNVIHALAWYFPDSTGGTEVYVSGLVHELPAFGVGSRIAAAHAGAQSFDYVQDGVDVHRYPFAEAGDLAATRGQRPDQNFDAFIAWLAQQPRGIYHQHSWTASCGLHHISAAKSLGFKTVLTVHVPSNICLRGTMMEFGSAPCDGRVEAGRCASCWSHGRGLSRPMARALGRLPRLVSRAAYRSHAESRLLTALGARELAMAKRQQIRAMADAADRIVAVSDWLAGALRRNGISAEKLVLSRQGVDRGFVGQAKNRYGGNDIFRLGFLGRCDPTKGVYLLVDAFRRLPADVPIELEICAAGTENETEKYRDEILRSAAGDRRIRVRSGIAHAEVGDFLASIDALAVPSQWLETGPLVVLEAFAVGTPVIGSDLGGIKELVSHGRDGLLVAHDDVSAWAATLARLATDRTLLQRLRQRTGPVRTMSDVASDMATVYRELSAIGANAA
jgi:glycosyltransferase involved in cell wall biosynthesis